METKRITQMNFLKNRNRVTDIKKKLMVTKREGTGNVTLEV